MLTKQSHQIILVSAFLGLAAEASAQSFLTPLSQEAFFSRCYAHVTGQRLPKSHPLLAQVKNGTLLGKTACIQVLESAKLNTNGQLITNTPESRAVLNNLNKFHMDWFMVRDFSNRPQSYTQGELRHNDMTEPGLYITRLLLGVNESNQPLPYSQVFTGTQSVRAIRSLGPYVHLYWTGGNGIFPLTVPHTGLQRGELIGISAWDPALNTTWYRDDGSTVTSFGSTLSHRSFKGGIPGLQSYMWMNFQNKAKADGALVMPRRWASHLVEDFLCRDLPMLRTADVVDKVDDYLETYPDPTTQIAFRQNTACMSCHDTIDPMGAMVRTIAFSATNPDIDWNVDGVISNGNGGIPSDRHSYVAPFSGSLLANETLPLHLINLDTNFYKRKPKGHVRYRNFDGDLVYFEVSANDQISAIEQWGQQMAAQDDPYVCAASRYFEYFTGVETKLYDPGDPRNPALTEGDQAYKNLVVALGQSLRSHQSLLQLVKDIIGSEIYRSQGMRLSGD